VARARRGQSPHQHSASQGVSNTRTEGTVASLGVQARLVRDDPDRERDVADLIAACERLRQEWDRLFTRVVERLREEGRDGCVDYLPYPPTCD
jgi:hypothetical protein